MKMKSSLSLPSEANGLSATANWRCIPETAVEGRKMMMIKRMSFVVLLLAPFVAVGCDAANVNRYSKDSPVENSGYSWQQGEGVLALKKEGRLVWQFNYRAEENNVYFHPVSLVDGTVLTALRPDDHKWHMGVWFSWKFINGANYWDFDPGTGLWEGLTGAEDVEILFGDDGSARITVGLNYHRPDEPAVMTEKRILIVSRPDKTGSYTIDWDSTFTAGDRDVELTRTPIPGQPQGVAFGGYAGLSVRLSKDLNDNTVISSSGKTNMDAHGQTARWLDYTCITGAGKTAGITVFDHPKNLPHPVPWYVSMKNMKYFSPALLFNEGWTLKSQTSVGLRYRLLVHPDALDRHTLEQSWEKYARTD